MFVHAKGGTQVAMVDDSSYFFAGSTNGKKKSKMRKEKHYIFS